VASCHQTFFKKYWKYTQRSDLGENAQVLLQICQGLIVEQLKGLEAKHHLLGPLGEVDGGEEAANGGRVGGGGKGGAVSNLLLQRVDVAHQRVPAE
jgi:hypothetical protein